MLDYDEIRLEMEGLEPQLKELEAAMNISRLKKEAEELEAKSTEPNFWDDAENSQKIMQKIGGLKNKIESFKKLKESYEDVVTMIELANEEGHPSWEGCGWKWSLLLFFRANMTARTLFSHSMREQAAPKHRTG